MANKLYEENNIKAIADAIRAKGQTTDTMKVSEMATKILAIPTGGITPTGNKNIVASTSKQSNIDIANYATVSIDPTPSETKNVSVNGEVIPSDGKLLSKVTVNVPSDALKTTLFTSQSNYYPNQQNLNRVYEVLRNAIEFYNAGVMGGTNKTDKRLLKWDYSDGNNAFKLKVTNDSGDGVIDCSGFVGMIMRGWGFFDSIYNIKRSQINATCTPNDTHKSDNNYQWDWDYQFHGEQLTYGSNASLKFSNYWRVITAADQAAYFASQGRLYKYIKSDPEHSPQIGDICFFEKADGNNGRFLNISHVGFMLTPFYYLNATATKDNEGILVTDIETRPPQYYARPNYYDWKVFEPSTISSSLNLIPRTYYSMGESETEGGTTYYCAEDGNITFTGTRTAATTYSIISSYCPLILPAGTYRLSGFVNNTGTNTNSATHKMWGMRVYGTTNLTTPGVAHSGLTGTTWSSNGANSATRPIDSSDPAVWDIGGGCEFTLTQETAISIDLYCGGAGKDYSKISCKPVLNKIA